MLSSHSYSHLIPASVLESKDGMTRSRTASEQLIWAVDRRNRQYELIQHNVNGLVSALFRDKHWGGAKFRRRVFDTFAQDTRRAQMFTIRLHNRIYELI